MMTTAQLIQYYTNLLIMQYHGKPKATATISALVSQVIMNQLPSQVSNAYTIGFAAGVQLDVIGKYAGITRSFYYNSTKYTLTDADFSQLILFAIIENSAFSSLAEIQALLKQFFNGSVYVFDYKNMRMSYFISSSVGSQNLVRALISESLLPKPMGVQLAATIYNPTINSFFAMVSYDSTVEVNSKPFNTYDSNQSSWGWLSYSNGVQ